MQNFKTRLAAVVITLALAVGLSMTGGSMAIAKDSAASRAAAVVQPSPDTVGALEVKPKSLGNGEIADNSLPQTVFGNAFRTRVTTIETNATSALTKANEANERLDNLPKPPAYLANWGEIFRNTIGNARADLGQSSSGEGVNFNVPTAADAVSFGNEADFAGKPVSLNLVKYDVFTTGENIALGQNMPSIKIEIKDPTSSATYTTLNYNPTNSASNDWTLIDAKADAGKHWGFTGTWFNADPSRCGQNGARCTLAEALDVLGANAKYISVGIGKGRDYAFHGAVRSLTINGDTFKFTKGGVTVS